ncbi:MAG: nucleoside triphosphate pyrophosphohydrolase [Sarcina sp.]
MFRLIGIGTDFNEKSLNIIIEKQLELVDEIYLMDGLLDFVEKNDKIISLNLIKNKDDLLNLKDKEITIITIGDFLKDYSNGKKFLKAIKKQNIGYELIKGESLRTALEESIEIVDEFKSFEAFEDYRVDRSKGLFIYEIKNKKTMEKIVSDLQIIYGKDKEIFYLTNLEDNQYHKKILLKLSEVINCYEENILSSIYIEKDRRSFDDLVEIIETLRAPNGCPWDREQNHQSIKRELVEECYEVLDAIDKNNFKDMEEEIGDVLLHVVFHGLIARENEEFDIYDITEGICSKMIFRHPHIFGDEIANNSEEVLVNWEEIKKEEKGFESLEDEINGIAKGLPALIRAKKVQKKAAKVGFDFKDFEEATEVLESEIKEFKDVYKSKNMTRIEDELGDVLFSVVNVGRLFGFDLEELLEKSTEKFIRRFVAIEKKALSLGLDLKNMTIDEMNELWILVKVEQKS